jgi:3',5'-cyclic AMP phosphodiesterase CpdA
VRILLLATLRFVDKVEGELGTEQLAWLDEALAGFKDKPVVVLGHHNPQLPPRPQADDLDKATELEGFKISGLVDTEPFITLLEKHPQVKAYVFGHTHAWNHTRRPSGLHLLNLPPVAYVFQKDRPNGWVSAVADGSTVSLRLQAFAADHPSAGQTVEIKLG